jgi:hypothetical protein
MLLSSKFLPLYLQLDNDTNLWWVLVPKIDQIFEINPECEE